MFDKILHNLVLESAELTAATAVDAMECAGIVSPENTHNVYIKMEHDVDVDSENKVLEHLDCYDIKTEEIDIKNENLSDMEIQGNFPLLIRCLRLRKSLSILFTNKMEKWETKLLT